MERKPGQLQKLIREKAGNLFWIKIIGVGNDGVGKTCLIKHFCEKKFTKAYHSTVGVDYGFKIHKVHGIDYRVHFWDFGGHADYNEIRRELYHQTQVCILVYDVTNRSSFQCLDRWLQEVASCGGTQNAIIAVVANKIDAGAKRTVSTMEGQNWAKAHDFRYYETSSASGQGVQELFHELLTVVVESKLVKPKPVISSTENRAK